MVSGERQAEIIYEDDFILAFYGLHFCAPVHALVIPKIIKNVMDLTTTDEHCI
ncbi:HIT domain-containing protein [Shouchella xiaoxiensis]|uniref:HIT domain-containing protein n=1 Tax=Shouchella xiaoxiensis TaxID=766895 RepID=UPI003461ED91